MDLLPIGKPNTGNTSPRQYLILILGSENHFLLAKAKLLQDFYAKPIFHFVTYKAGNGEESLQGLKAETWNDICLENTLFVTEYDFKHSSTVLSDFAKVQMILGDLGYCTLGHFER